MIEQYRGILAQVTRSPYPEDQEQAAQTIREFLEKLMHNTTVGEILVNLDKETD